MDDAILTDLSTPSLQRAIKENLYEYFRFLGRAEITEMDEGPGWLRWSTPISHSWFNGLLCSRPPSAGDATLVEDTLAYFRSRAVPAITWWLSPDQPPAAWAPLLQSHGFHFNNSTPGMALALDVLPSLQQLPPGLKIVRVEDMATLQAWIDVFAGGYPIPVEMKPLFLSLLAGLGFEPPIRHYLGLLDGLPVGTSNMYLGAGVAGVMFVATLPAARRRGVGAALTLAPLFEARQLGYRLGILQSSEMGYQVYRQLGFQHLTSMENYYWPG
jgi:GNAT superfamily N-acetyltransferase